jgi:hypothetical protein
MMYPVNLAHIGDVTTYATGKVDVDSIHYAERCKVSTTSSASGLQSTSGHFCIHFEIRFDSEAHT